MVVGIAFVIAAVLGIITGARNRNKALLVGSALLLIIVVAVWIYFYNNQY